LGYRVVESFISWSLDGKIYFGRCAGLKCQGAKASDWSSLNEPSSQTNQVETCHLIKATLEVCDVPNWASGSSSSHAMKLSPKKLHACSVCQTSAPLQFMNIGLIMASIVRSTLLYSQSAHVMVLLWLPAVLPSQRADAQRSLC
jgi:hypothetical protein